MSAAGSNSPSSNEPLSSRPDSETEPKSTTQGISTSSSGFTEQEIWSELCEMGYVLDRKQVVELKKELDQMAAVELALDPVVSRFETAHVPYVPARDLQATSESPAHPLARDNMHSSSDLNTNVYSCTAPSAPADIAQLLGHADALQNRAEQILSPPQHADSEQPTRAKRPNPGQFTNVDQFLSAPPPHADSQQHTDGERQVPGQLFTSVDQFVSSSTPHADSKQQTGAERRVPVQFTSVDQLLSAADLRSAAGLQLLHEIDSLFINGGASDLALAELSGGSCDGTPRKFAEKADNAHGKKVTFAKTAAKKENDQRLDSTAACGTDLLSSLSDMDLEQYIEAFEKLMKSDPLLQPTIRPVICPSAGGLPFKHDPVKRYELYRRFWTKYPAPGEQKRMQLRWKVREYMLRQDIPQLARR